MMTDRSKGPFSVRKGEPELGFVTIDDAGGQTFAYVNVADCAGQNEPAAKARATRIAESLNRTEGHGQGVTASSSAGRDGVGVSNNHQGIVDPDPERFAERYAMGLMVEEMGETLKLIGKALRFGLDAPGPANEEYRGETARQLLPIEVGDVHAAFRFAAMAGIFKMTDANVRESAKLARLLDPLSIDSNGKRLAPDLPAMGGDR